MYIRFFRFLRKAMIGSNDGQKNTTEIALFLRCAESTLSRHWLKSNASKQCPRHNTRS